MCYTAYTRTQKMLVHSREVDQSANTPFQHGLEAGVVVRPCDYVEITCTLDGRCSGRSGPGCLDPFVARVPGSVCLDNPYYARAPRVQ